MVGTPESLAVVIHRDFVALQRELAVLVVGQPDAARLGPKIAQPEERFTWRFAGYGRVRERMGDGDAGEVESEFSRLLFTPPTIDISPLSTATARFAQADGTLDILTQFALVGLLRKQEPTEAALLGIN